MPQLFRLTFDTDVHLQSNHQSNFSGAPHSEMLLLKIIHGCQPLWPCRQALAIS